MHAPGIEASVGRTAQDIYPRDSGAKLTQQPVDREAQLKLLGEQIAAVERGPVEPAVVEPAVDEHAVDERAVDERAVDERAVDERAVVDPAVAAAVVEPAVDEPVVHDRGAGYAGRRARNAGGRGATDEVSAELSPAQQTAAARAICLRLLTVAPRPRAGLAQALERKEIPKAIAESVLGRLTEVGLIDDVAYAHSFVRTKHRDRALGRTALRTELRRLGVDEESMAGAVETVDSDAERTRAQDLISKRLDAAMSAGSVAARRRLLGLLGRRGYPPDIAIPVVDDAIAAYSDGADDGSPGPPGAGW